MFTGLTLKDPIVLYCRNSSDAQMVAHTIEAQLSALRSFCASHNITIAAEYTDEGVCGDMPWSDRPAARQLLIDAAAGKVGTVMVYLYDRFSRDVLEGLLAARELQNAGGKPFSINEPFDINTPYGRKAFIDSLNNAQYAKATLLERTREGMRHKAGLGQWVSGMPPFGYRVHGLRGQRHLIANDADMVPGIDLTPRALIAWLFEQIADHRRSLGDVAEHLNLMGAPTPSMMYGKRQRSRSSSTWTTSTIYGIVSNPVYKGVLQFSRKEPIFADCLALVSPDLWDRTQAAMQRNKRGSKRNAHRDYLLSGLILCGVCGCVLSGFCEYPDLDKRTEGRRGAAYACYRRHKVKGIVDLTPCRSAVVPAYIEVRVWNRIVRLLNSPAEIADVVDRMRQGIGQASDVLSFDKTRLEAARVAMEKKDRERQNILRFLRQETIDQSDADFQLAEIKTERAGLQKIVDELQKSVEAATRAFDDAERVADTVRRAVLNLQGKMGASPETLTFAEKREVVTAFVENITATTMGTVGEGKARFVDLRIRYRFAADGTEPAYYAADLTDT